MTMEVEIGVMQSQGMPGATRSWERQGTNSQEPLEGMRPCYLPAPPFHTSGLQNHERINSQCFMPPDLWGFITIALGNS